MPKLPSPLLGYNNNVRHKGKVFHVQTEDSGVKYGHIITHLFMDGGRILKSVKTSYAEYVENDRMGEIVREMMKQQHKAMFIALRDGKFDVIIEGAELPQSTPFPAATPAAPPAPLSSPALDGPTAHPAEMPSAARTLEAKRTLEGARTIEAPVARTPAPAAARSAPAPAVAKASGLVPSPPRVEPEDDGPATLRGTMDSARVLEAGGQTPEDLAVDIDAVERAAAAASGAAPALRGAVDLPPPPASLFREKSGAGKYRVTSSSAPARASSSGPTAARPPSSSPIPAAAAVRAAGTERRYAPTRPASIFGQARPQQGKSIFGEDLISDKSLDEVILSYLAEDLEGEKK
jgi:hypothetical protein